jgi:hypothetical protein
MKQSTLLVVVFLLAMPQANAGIRHRIVSVLKAPMWCIGYSYEALDYLCGSPIREGMYAFDWEHH